MKRTVLLAIAALAATWPCSRVRAADFAVATTADGVDVAPGDGICADAGGACTLRAAVQETNALAGADRITLPAGRYVLALAGAGEDAGASGDLDVHDALSLVGAGVEATFIDGNAADTVIDLHADARTARLEHLAIVNGWFEAPCTDWACSGAGGLFVRAGVMLALRHVDFRDNRSQRFNTMSAVLNHGCIDGDYVRVIGNGPATAGTLQPMAPFGGSLEAIGNPPEPFDPPHCIALDHSEISGNHGNRVGAMELNYTRLTLRRSLVSGNTAVVTGAFSFNVYNDVLFENVTIAGNHGNSYGALLHDGHSDARLDHVTIVDNEGTQVGGIAEANTPEHALVLSNTLIAGNRLVDPRPWSPAPDCAGDFISAGGVLIGSSVRPGASAPPDPSTQCTIVPQRGDRFDTPLALEPLADHGGFTRTILPVDAAIDGGVTAACAPTDQRDLVRPAAAGCDIGAVELGAAADRLLVDGFDRLCDPAACPR